MGAIGGELPLVDVESVRTKVDRAVRAGKSIPGNGDGLGNIRDDDRAAAPRGIGQADDLRHGRIVVATEGELRGVGIRGAGVDGKIVGARRVRRVKRGLGVESLLVVEPIPARLVKKSASLPVPSPSKLLSRTDAFCC